MRHDPRVGRVTVRFDLSHKQVMLTSLALEVSCKREFNDENLSRKLARVLGCQLVIDVKMKFDEPQGTSLR